MKYFIASLAAVLLLVSCHNHDDDNGAQSSLILPKSGVDTFYDGETVSTQYKYSGNKLVRITWDDGYYETYTYKSGKLKNTYLYVDGELFVKKTFDYDGDKLVKLTTDDYDEQWRDVNEYTYSGNTVTVKEYDQDLEEQDDVLELGSTVVLTFENGNITQFVRTYPYGDGDVETYTYSFDDKHDPFTNIFAADVIILSQLEGGFNNYTHYAATTPEGNWETDVENTYDENGYLIKSVETTSGTTYSYTINYN